MAFQNPKGTRDYYPEDRAVWNWMADAFRKTAVSFGFQEVESPAFENLSVLCEKEGEEIKRQIFTLEKRGDESFGLRFDLTVPFTRMFVQKQRELPKPVKWFGISRMWRYEQPQKGRLREFYQFSCEVFGSPTPEADAQVIRMAIEMMEGVGLSSKDIAVRINNRILLQGILEGLGIKEIEETIIVIDKKSKIGDAAFEEELKKLKLAKNQISSLQCMLAVTDLSRLQGLSKEAQVGKEQLQAVFDLLDDKKEYLQVDLTTARGLAYYTSTVFEIFDRGRKYRALCGGGRYNNMIKQFGGEDCPATGFAIGFATMELLLDEKMKLPTTATGVDYYIALISQAPAVKKAAQQLAAKLRSQGSSVDADVMGRSLGKQMEYANKLKAKNVIVMGENEVKAKKAKVKEMESGKESTINL
ncbi:histidine--tRNA ligase [Candidatus Woesearchaeota archaeon]|nr:histidine--tRNA ligase [Candidatus Woesearchaeota archaeon]